MIRIRKGGREFTAKRIEVVRELVRRGLLGADDPVSIDDGPFVPASQVPQLAECLQTQPASLEGDIDPWSHWSSTSLDSGEWESEAEGVLSSFLDVVTASSMPTLDALLASQNENLEGSAEQLTADPDRSIRHSDPDAFPPSLSAVAPVAVPSEEEMHSEHDGQEVQSAGVVLSPSDAPAVKLRPEPDSEQSDGPDLPVSFTQWLQSRNDSDNRDSLGPLGARDDGLLPSYSDRSSNSFSFWRVGIVISVGLVLVGIYHLVVSTGANDDFPTEIELLEKASARASLPAPVDDLEVEGAVAAEARDGEVVTTPPPPVSNLSAEFPARVSRIRNKVTGNIVPFSNSEMLKNSLFLEYLNLGVQPSEIEVEALRVLGSLDKDAQRPVLANIKVEIQGVEGEDDNQRITRFEDRLLTVWLVLGKYATLGKVSLNEVRVVMGEPTPWDKSYEGRVLAGLWEDSVLPEELFPR